MNGLVAEGVSVTYGTVVALADVHIAVPRGEIVGLIGPNGAGKTTFIDAVTGFVPAGGTVRLDGRSIDDLAPHRRVAAGVVRTFQSGGLISELTVLENATMAARRVRDEQLDPIEVLRSFGLEEVAGDRPDDLSHGRRQLVGMARAVLSSPAVVLLDEPAAGLDTAETDGLRRPIERLADHGVGVLLVDHDIDFVSRTCSTVYALDFGRIIAHGTPVGVLATPEVQNAYLGTATEQAV